MSDTSVFEFGFTHNRKVRKLSDAAFRLWVTAIDHANQDGSDGVIAPDDLDCFPRSPRGKERDAAVYELVGLGLWHNHGTTGWVIHDFLEWQEAAAERNERKTRDRERMSRKRSLNVRRTERADDSGHPPNVAGTSGDETAERSDRGEVAPSPRTPLSDPEELVSKEVRESGSPELPESKGSGRGRARKTRLDSGWAPTAEHATRAASMGLSLEGEVERFRLHAEASGRLMANWNAAFTTWLINAPRFAPKGPVGGRQQGPKQPNAGVWKPVVEGR